MEAFTIKRVSILIILIYTRKDPKLKELKVIPELKLMMMNQLFTKPVTSSFPQLLKNQLM